MNLTVAQQPANNWQPPVRNYAPPEQNQGAPQPTDGYTRGGNRPLADTVSRYTAVGATALTVAAIAGASEGALSALGVPVAIGGIAAVVLTFAQKSGSIGALKQGSTIDKAARIAAFSAVAAGVVSAAGGGDVLTGLAAIPMLVAAPVATGLWAREAMKGRQPQGQQPPAQAQTWAPPAPVQFQQNQQPPAAPVQFGAPPAAPVQFGSNQPAPAQQGTHLPPVQQQGDGPPPPPTFNGKAYWQQ